MLPPPPYDGYASPTLQSIADCLSGNTGYQDGKSGMGWGSASSSSLYYTYLSSVHILNAKKFTLFGKLRHLLNYLKPGETCYLLGKFWLMLMGILSPHFWMLNRVSPPSRWAKQFWCMCLQSHVQTFPPFLRNHTQSFITQRPLLKIPLCPPKYS